VSTGKSDNLLIIETHSVEDESKVVLSLSGIRKSTIGQSIVVLETVNSSRSPRDLGSTTLLDGANTTKGPEITVGDPRELLLDELHVVSCDVLYLSVVLSMRIMFNSQVQHLRPTCSPWGIAW
jgi:hypothetical protein